MKNIQNNSRRLHQRGDRALKRALTLVGAVLFYSCAQTTSFSSNDHMHLPKPVEKAEVAFTAGFCYNIE